MTDRHHLACPSCGRSAQREGHCTHCGARIDQAALAGRGISAREEGVVVHGARLRIGTDGETRECPHCGAPVVADRGQTCLYCGGNVVIEKIELRSLVIEEGGSLVITGGSVVIGGGDEDSDEDGDDD